MTLARINQTKIHRLEYLTVFNLFQWLICYQFIKSLIIFWWMPAHCWPDLVGDTQKKWFTLPLFAYKTVSSATAHHFCWQSQMREQIVSNSKNSKSIILLYNYNKINFKSCQFLMHCKENPSMTLTYFAENMLKAWML